MGERFPSEFRNEWNLMFLLNVISEKIKLTRDGVMLLGPRQLLLNTAIYSRTAPEQAISKKDWYVGG